MIQAQQIKRASALCRTGLQQHLEIRDSFYYSCSLTFLLLVFRRFTEKIIFQQMFKTTLNGEPPDSHVFWFFFM